MKPLLLAAGLSVFPLAAVANTPQTTDVVEAFIGAYNQHSVEQMLQHVVDDVRWMHITGTKIEVETAGKAQFGAAMADYFETLGEANATILSMIHSSHFVSTVERVTWLNEGELLSQCSIGNFRIEGGKIAEFWYLPAHACDDVELTPPVDDIAPPEVGKLIETRQ
ncbi:hypothetical protein TUM4644_11360 [Shewanella colwelliana]|uniref:SnoaL-like domain-containing protein n=1 Tax=Shewanella colwelliana TaxID=23 RepID=A0ABQ4NWQ9_SHECO|nr:nuclear transport factor 2 family protein [Shewanella colwelliana]MDX1281007.1 nuclear transport factor 2 family protein [Shewanella colwelliana]GIU20950.1 hypothetical protein TUM4644_11360 [Shewanella colwelliana]GIU38398.1 hypothetical protein TUM3794_10790 [Shewanella colwelliana]